MRIRLPALLLCLALLLNSIAPAVASARSTWMPGPGGHDMTHADPAGGPAAAEDCPHASAGQASPSPHDGDAPAPDDDTCLAVCLALCLQQGHALLLLAPASPPACAGSAPALPACTGTPQRGPGLLLRPPIQA